MTQKEINEKEIKFLVESQQLDDQYLSDIDNADNDTVAGNVEFFCRNLSTYCRKKIKLIEDMYTFYESNKLGLPAGYGLHLSHIDSGIRFWLYTKALRELARLVRSYQHKLASKAVCAQPPEKEDELKALHERVDQFIKEKLIVPGLKIIDSTLNEKDFEEDTDVG